MSLIVSPILIPFTTTHTGGSNAGIQQLQDNYKIEFSDPCEFTQFETPIPIIVTVDAYFSINVVFDEVWDTVSRS